MILYPNCFSFRDNDFAWQTMSFEYIDRHLWDFVEVQQTVTVRTLMEIFRSSDFGFWQKVLGEPFLLDLIEHYEKNLLEKQIPKFDTILFSWNNEYNDEEFFSMLTILGLIENSEENSRNEYGLTLTPLKDMIDSYVEVDNKFSIWVYDDQEDFKQKPLHFGSKSPTLLELLRAFVYEITFLGTEKNKKDQTKKIEQIMEDVQNGKAELKNFEVLRKELKDKIQNKKDDSSRE